MAHPDQCGREREATRQQFGAPDDARDGFDMDGVGGEEQSRQRGGPARLQHVQRHPVHEHRYRRVQDDVDQVESGRTPAVDEALEGERQHRDRPIHAPGRAQPVRRGEQVLPPRPSLDGGVARHDRPVVERELIPDRPQVHQGRHQDDAPENDPFRPGRDSTLGPAPHRSFLSVCAAQHTGRQKPEASGNPRMGCAGGFRLLPSGFCLLALCFL